MAAGWSRKKQVLGTMYWLCHDPPRRPALCGWWWFWGFFFCSFSVLFLCSFLFLLLCLFFLLSSILFFCVLGITIGTCITDLPPPWGRAETGHNPWPLYHHTNRYLCMYLQSLVHMSGRKRGRTSSHPA